jgi:hypothetical protein
LSFLRRVCGLTARYLIVALALGVATAIGASFAGQNPGDAPSSALLFLVTAAAIISWIYVFGPTWRPRAVDVRPSGARLGTETQADRGVDVTFWVEAAADAMFLQYALRQDCKLAASSGVALKVQPAYQDTIAVEWKEVGSLEFDNWVEEPVFDGLNSPTAGSAVFVGQLAQVA